MTNTRKTTRILCEGAISIALAYALSFLELDLWFQGGSIGATMIPLILFAVRWGAGWGLMVGLVFGSLKYFLGLSSWALDWVSIVFDYSVAYAMVGLSGLFKGKVKLISLAAATGSLARFLIHYVSGFTVYAKWMPEEFMGLPMTSPFIYSALYNGGYILPCAILAIVVCVLLVTVRPIRNWLEGNNLK